jgi:hypothetical protein
MKKATLVLATAVAFLLSGPVFAARKVVDMPSTGTILSGSTSSIAENGVLKVSGGALVGEYIPGVKNALAIVPETKIASSAISNLAKGAVRGGLAGVAGTLIVGELLDGLDWVMHDGSVVKKSGQSGSLPVDTSSGAYYWRYPYPGWPASSTALGACPQTANIDSYSQGSPLTGVVFSGDSIADCRYARTYSNGQVDESFSVGYSVARYGDSCPAGSTYNASTGACSGSVTYAPLSESDFSTLDGFVKGKDGVWQRDLTTTLCQGNEDCYKALSPQTSLTGPAKVTGTPQTITTTSPNGAVSTSVKTPTSTITYGPNYYDYSTTTTTTTNNGGDTTTINDDTDTSLPVPPNIFGGANDGIGGIPGDIAGTTSHTSPIPYMPWWSFSQSCEEITFVIPVYGAVTTAICPVYKKYIWPVLYFMFAVYTWLSCWGIWRATVLKVRAF